MASLELQRLLKEFSGAGDGILAVDEVDLEADDGEFIVLVGPSGSGKSTILRMIAGLESPTDGRIHIGEDDVTDIKPKNRDIAMVFQNYALYPHLSARKNMSFGLKMQGTVPSEEIDERVEEAAAIMDIEDILDKMPSELSGGQKQRVALGRAIVRDPQVFLMDEPLSNLDAKLRTQMRTEIQRLQSDLDVTTVYVTHDQTEAMTMGDRIAILHDGELQQFATPVETYYEPANRFVASFIGSPSMNFIDVTASLSDGSFSLEHTEFSYPCSGQFEERELESGQDFVLGVRPEDVEISPDDSDTVLDVTIDVVEPLGKEELLYFDIDGRTYTASASGHPRIQEGERIAIGFPEPFIYLFDRETGNTIKHREQPEGERRATELSPDPQ